MIRCLVVALAACVARADLTPGAKAPPITLEAISNTDREGPLSWEGFAGKTVVLKFWGTWCGPCVGEIPELNEIARALEGREDIVFLSVTFESPEITAPFTARRPMRAIIGHDSDRSMVNDYGIRAWPATFIIRDGVIVSARSSFKLTAEWIARIADATDPDAIIAEERERHERYLAARREEDAKRAEQRRRMQSLNPDTLVQVVVIPASEDALQSVRVSSKHGRRVLLEMDKASVREIVRTLWEIEDWRIEGDEAGALSREYQILVKIPFGDADLWEHLRPLVAAGMEVRVTEDRRKHPGYRVSAPQEGHQLGPAESAVNSFTTSFLPRQWFRIEAKETRLDTILRSVSTPIGARFEIPEELKGMTCDVDLTLPWNDPEKSLQLIRDAIGIEFELFEDEVTFLRIRPLAL
jgi:thiol-disulfide isomerase/thioredoxin